MPHRASKQFFFITEKAGYRCRLECSFPLLSFSHMLFLSFSLLASLFLSLVVSFPLWISHTHTNTLLLPLSQPPQRTVALRAPLSTEASGRRGPFVWIRIMADSRKQNNYTGITMCAAFRHIRSSGARRNSRRSDNPEEKVKEFEAPWLLLIDWPLNNAECQEKVSLVTNVCSSIFFCVGHIKGQGS